MFELKEKEYTLNTYLKAIRSVGDTTSYVGTFYDSPMLNHLIVAHPNLGVEYSEDNEILTLDVSLKPGAGEDSEAVERLDTYLYALNMGFLNRDPDPVAKSAKNKHTTLMGKFLSQNSVTSEIKDHTVTLVFSNPLVKRMDTVINGVRYWKYTVSESVNLGEGVTYSHTVHSLFKEKTSEGENFFSGVVGKELNKRDSIKVLDSLADKNITGFYIGGHSLYPKSTVDERMITTLYGITGNAELRKYDETYHIVIPGGGTHVPFDSIKNVSVRRVGDGRYTVELHTSVFRAVLYVG